MLLPLSHIHLTLIQILKHDCCIINFILRFFKSQSTAKCLQIYLTPYRYRFLILCPSHTSCPCVCWAPDPRPFYTVSLPGDISFVHSRYYPYSLLTVLKENVFHEIKLAPILMIFSQCAG